MMRFDPARERALKAASLSPEQIRSGAPAGFFEGAISAPVTGVGAGLMQAGGLLYGAAGSLVRGYNKVLTWQNELARLAGLPEGGQISTEWLDAQRDKTLNLAQAYKPGPLRTGMAGQIMFDLSRIMTQVATGAGVAAATGGTGATALLAGAATTGAATTVGKFAELKKSGVDDKTALQVAAIEGLVTGGGVVVPAALGYKTLTQAGVTGAKSYLGANVLYGAGANIGLGVTERAVVYDLLHERYPAMAAHYQPLEVSALIAEGALGAIFGAVGARAGLHYRAQEITDAALVAREAKHAALDTAPGIPADPATANAHARALNTAMEQLLKGETVNVAETGITDGQFVPRPQDSALPDAVREHYGADAEPRPPAGTPEAVVQSQGFRQWYGERTVEQIEAEYQALPDTYEGRIIDADLVRELAPDYVANRARSAELHPYASALTKVLFARALARPVAEGRAPVVQFLAGGGGSGKSTATKEAVARTNADIVMDGTLSNLERARKDIESALANGRIVVVDYVYRSPQKSVEGAIERAITRGRPVPVHVLADTHAGAARTIKSLAQEYNGNDDVKITAHWNDGEMGTSREMPIQEVPDVDRDQAEQIFRAAVDAEVQAGRVDDGLREAFLAARNIPSNRGKPQSQRAGEGADSLTSKDIPHVDRDQAEQIFRAAVDAEVQTLRLDDSLRKAFLVYRDGPQAVQGAKQTRPEQHAPDALAPDEASADAPLTAARATDDLETRAGLALLEERGDMQVPVENESGEIVYVSLQEALREADAEAAYANKNTFDAAVQCALTKQHG